MNPSVSNNYLYQQHFQHLQQPKQQRLQQQQANANTTVMASPAPTSSYVPGCGGQQRYVGSMATTYVIPNQQHQSQQHPSSQQSQLITQHLNVMSPSRTAGSACGTITAQQHQYGKQSSPSNGPYHHHGHDIRGGGGGRIVSDMMVIAQPDSFRRISGLTSDVFRQIEQVEQQFDPSSLASTQYAEMERRGEMIIRILSPTQILPQWLDDTLRRFGDGVSLPSWIQFVEIIKRPGQTLGLYIREGDGLYTMDGVYISRIALESPVYQSGCLRVGDEVLAINFVDVSRMSLDDVVLIMSIPRRLILTIRSRPLNAEHMLTNRSIYGTGMSDSCYYDTVAGDIYSRVDDLRSKPVVVVKQQQSTDPSLMLDEDEEEEVFQAASAAAEAGLLDDPSTAAAAAVAALQDPTPAKAAAAVAAVNEIMVRSGSSLELYGSNAGSSLMMTTRSRRNRRLFTSDNLADLYQSETERAIANSNLYANIQGTRSGKLSSSPLMTTVNQKPIRTPLSSLYHGRLAHHGSRSRSATGRLMRTSSEQMLYGGLHQDPGEQIDHFLQRYQSLKQMQRGHRPMRTRHHSLDHSSMLSNSYSTQSLIGAMPSSNYRDISHQHGMAIPLPGMAEAVAIARRRYLRGETNIDSSGNLFDRSYSDTEQQYGEITDRFNRSNSLPRTPGLSGRHSHHRASSSLSNRLQQLEQFYSSTKSHGLRSSARPHSAMAGNYDAQDIATDSSTADMLSRMRRTGQNRYSGQGTGAASQLMSSTRLDSLRASLAESSSSEDVLAKSRSSSRTAAAAASTSAIYETIRKSKMAQDLQQPQSGRLAAAAAAAAGSTTDDMKSRFSSLQISRHSSDTHGFNRPPYDDMLDTCHTQQQPQVSSATTSLIGQISTRPSRILMIDPSGFQQYGPDLHRQTTATIGTGGKNDGQIAGYSGLLVIHLLGVRGLQLDHLIATKSVTSKTGAKRVLYSVVECDRIYKARTVAVQSHENNSSNFDWDEVFDIDLFDTKEVSFLFYTWDQSLPDLNMRHKQCSKGTIHLPSIPALTKQHVHAFELRLYDTPGAMFYIKLEYHDLITTFKRSKRDHKSGVRTSRSSMSGPRSSTIGEQPLFGVDLETVIAREASGFSVPLIIKRCCEEIEQRGLHMLGIYRLCGSSLVKRTLRESFERNAWLADINAENVPDINVITSE